MTDPTEVTDFWFGELHDGLADDQHRRPWFAPDPARDADIRDRFGHLLAAAAGGELVSWLETPDHTLALVIVCDQFSRQIHRGTALAYATDPVALEAARCAVEHGRDADLGFDERAFLYMPFQHSESRLDQHTCVGLFTRLRDDTSPAQRHHADGFLQHARQHRDIVLRFGRFPHRNRILERASTPEELTFLENATSFGQTPAPPG
jgi:uncharacterized protein (DUF924 family)